MIAQSQFPFITPQDYLDWEEKQSLKYEYIDGEVYAMTGGTILHNEIAVNLTTALKNHLRGKGCKVLMADAKVGISETGPFHYPDIMVSCDPRDKKARQIIYHPCLIIEVLSPSTEAFDRGKKFTNYRCLDSLKEYVIISADKINVECYRLKEKGQWELNPYSLEKTSSKKDLEIHLSSINFSLPISLIYEDIELEIEP
jgi:Uma2 family endonuclease